MSADAVCPRPLFQRDARALIGLVAVLEGEVWTSQLDQDFVQHLSRRFASEGLLPDRAGDRQFRQALNDLNHRIRYALGEYDEEPEPIPVI